MEYVDESVSAGYYGIAEDVRYFPYRAVADDGAPAALLYWGGNTGRSPSLRDAG